MGPSLYLENEDLSFNHMILLSSVHLITKYIELQNYRKIILSTWKKYFEDNMTRR